MGFLNAVCFQDCITYLVCVDMSHLSFSSSMHHFISFKHQRALVLQPFSRGKLSWRVCSFFIIATAITIITITMVVVTAIIGMIDIPTVFNLHQGYQGDFFMVVIVICVIIIIFVSSKPIRHLPSPLPPWYNAPGSPGLVSMPLTQRPGKFSHQKKRLGLFLENSLFISNARTKKASAYSTNMASFHNRRGIDEKMKTIEKSMDFIKKNDEHQLKYMTIEKVMRTIEQTMKINGKWRLTTSNLQTKTPTENKIPTTSLHP